MLAGLSQPIASAVHSPSDNDAPDDPSFVHALLTDCKCDASFGCLLLDLFAEVMRSNTDCAASGCGQISIAPNADGRRDAKSRCDNANTEQLRMEQKEMQGAGQSHAGSVSIGASLNDAHRTAMQQLATAPTECLFEPGMESEIESILPTGTNVSNDTQGDQEFSKGCDNTNGRPEESEPVSPRVNQDTMPCCVFSGPPSNYSDSAISVNTLTNGSNPVDLVFAILPALASRNLTECTGLQLNLFSQDLGRIQLSVCVADDQVRVHVFVGNGEAKCRLEAHSGELRARLAEMGFNLAHFEVEEGESENSRQSDSEHCAHSMQMEINGLPKLSKTPAQVTRLRTLVDIIA